MIFDTAESQYIDANGKCRIINFENVSLSTSPLPPLDKIEVSQTQTKLADIDSALLFIKKADLIITEQQGASATMHSFMNMGESEIEFIKGLWVKSNLKPPSIIFGYIPLESGVRILKNIPLSHEYVVAPVLETVENKSEESKLRNTLKNKKIALFLKEYSLYELAVLRDKFDIKNFVIDKDYFYDLEISNFQLPPDKRTNPFYSNGKIVVPDEETALRLITHVKILSLRDSTLLDNYASKTRIDNSAFFENISDFKSEQNQLIFLDKKGLIEWRNITSTFGAKTDLIQIVDTKLKAYISGNVSPDKSEPYYYRNDNIQKGRVMLLQNTKEGDLPSALQVSTEWELTGVNIGYNISLRDENIQKEYPLEVYTEEGLTHRSGNASSNSVKNKILKVFGYDNGAYAAILFL
jgi:hypothetical protein